MARFEILAFNWCLVFFLEQSGALTATTAFQNRLAGRVSKSTLAFSLDDDKGFSEWVCTCTGKVGRSQTNIRQVLGLKSGLCAP
jgi:hypothetical protein